MRRLFLITLFLKTGILLANDCKKISKEDVYNYADVIFLGHVFEVGDSIYHIKVIEWYKGNLADTLVGVITQNVAVPKVGSIWLIFGQKLSDTKFLADVCSGSKSLSLPHGTHDITLPDIPPPDILKNPSQLFLVKQLISDKALNEFYFDVASLRARKAQQENKLMSDRFSHLEKSYASLSREMSFIKWSLFILIIVSVGSLLLNFRRR
jgi:hypothetical protein